MAVFWSYFRDFFGAQNIEDLLESKIITSRLAKEERRMRRVPVSPVLITVATSCELWIVKKSFLVQL